MTIRRERLNRRNQELSRRRSHKTYAKKMPNLATVRDGSTGEFVPGYWRCVAMPSDSSVYRSFIIMRWQTASARFSRAWDDECQ